MRTELEAFREFFDSMGVSFSESRVSSRYKGGSVLSVSQAHFHFDEQGRFRGVEADEMGDFEARETALPLI